MNVAQALLARLIDYAGLFPPASLEMEAAVRNYQKYLAGPYSWMLGNFIVPAGRLAEFTQAFQTVCCDERENPWTLSVVCDAADLPVDLQTIQDFPQGAAFLSTFEFKATDAGGTRSVLAALPRGPVRYAEIAPDRADLRKLLPVLAPSGARAKLRTGGLTTAAIPTARAVAQFLHDCAHEHVPFKATAGLHHPVRSVHPLTYQMGSAQAAMHGFLNVFLAAALAWNGSTEDALVATLDEESIGAFQIEEDDDVIAWHDHRMTSDQMERVRREFAISFGSCSFTEPVDDLKEMGWL
jgi:hypothetical protein